VENNLGVRKIMIERGLVPEDLPPAEDVKKSRKKIEIRKRKNRKTQFKKGGITNIHIHIITSH
jgi:DNA-damage-inducible protein D